MFLLNGFVLTFWALIKCTKVHFNLRIISKVIVSTGNDDRRTDWIEKPFFSDLEYHESWTFIRKSGG